MINVSEHGPGSAVIDWDGNGDFEYNVFTLPWGGASPTIDTGTQVEIQLIDTESQRVIYETTITA